MKKACVVLSIIFLCSFAVTAQNFQYTAFWDYYGGIEGSEGYENLRSRIFMRPVFFGVEDNSGLEWNLSANLWVQPYSEYDDRESIDPWDILHETYLFLPIGPMDITLGQKIVTYGFADVFGPLNALHSANRIPYSIDDSFDARRPDPLLQLRFYPTFEDTIELTYVPITRPDAERPGPVILPGENPGNADRVEWSDDPYITDNLHSIFVNYNRYGMKMDFQAFYGYYVDHMPNFDIDVVDSSVASVIAPTYDRKHTLGVAYATRIGNVTLSQDFALNLTNDLAGTDIGAANSDITINTQLLAQLKGGILSQFSLVYAFHINHGNHDPGDTASEREEAEYLAAEVQNFHTQPLAHIAFLVAHFEKAFLREKLKTQLNVALIWPNVLFTPRISYAINDYWAIETGADITTGEPADYDLRRNPADDNFFVRMIFRY